MIGVLGGGQLGLMLAEAGEPLGLSFRFLDRNADAPARIRGELIVGDYEDQDVLESFARGLTHVTFEFENVALEALQWLAAHVATAPPTEALRISQDRLTEKSFFQFLGIPVPRFAAVDSPEDFARALHSVGMPAILKTRRFGYDGKGQCVIRDAADAELAWNRLGGRPLILEKFVPFRRELSIIAARARTGQVRCWPLTQNFHRDGILRWSAAPAPLVPDSLRSTAEDHARRLLESLNYVGVLAIEFFDAPTGLVANEFAPRVHNSGHWTIEGSSTSQFTNHLCALTGQSLGSTDALSPTVMVNLIGNLPDVSVRQRLPHAVWHDYGKEPRPGRKVGHVSFRLSEGVDVITEARRIHDILTVQEDAEGPPPASSG